MTLRAPPPREMEICSPPAGAALAIPPRLRPDPVLSPACGVPVPLALLLLLLLVVRAGVE